jgi:hypothetical protein
MAVAFISQTLSSFAWAQFNEAKQACKPGWAWLEIGTTPSAASTVLQRLSETNSNVKPSLREHQKRSVGQEFSYLFLPQGKKWIHFCCSGKRGFNCKIIIPTRCGFAKALFTHKNDFVFV